MNPQGCACPGLAKRAHQRGAVALTVGLVLLILATGGTFYVTRTSMIDQRIAADAIRARTAFEAAEAGMNFAISFMDVDGGRDLNGYGGDDRVEMLTGFELLDNDDAPNPTGTGVDDLDDGYGQEIETGYRLQATWNNANATYAWSFPTDPSVCDSSIRICLLISQVGSELTKVRVTSIGYTAEGVGDGAVKRITQDMRRVGAFPGNLGATHALITYGGVGVGGSMSIVNAFSNATIWAGNDVTSFGSGPNSGTFIHPDPRGATYEDSAKGDRIPYFDKNNDGTANSDEYLLYKSDTDTWSPKTDIKFDNFTKASGVDPDDKKSVMMGVDIIDNSADLRCDKTAKPNCFFNNFIAGEPDFAKLAADYITSKSDLGDPDRKLGPAGSFVWVDARNDDGTLSDFSLKNGTYGTREEPMILIIDGNFDPSAAPVIYGVVFVRGNVLGKGAGGGKLVGSLIVEGDEGFVDGSGGMDVIYDPNVIDRAGGGEGRNAVAPISGTWRDWRQD